MADPTGGQDKVMSYEEWDALYGPDLNKLIGVQFVGANAEKNLNDYKRQLYQRYLTTKGAGHSDDSYQYGGKAGGAEAAAAGYGNLAGQSLDQQQKFYDQQEQQLANAMEDRGRALEARGGQLTAADLMMARAQGKVPSIAQMQADRQMGQLAAEQTSQAASARGPAALALAQQNQANATATGQSAISGQAQINAAMERERAEQAAFGAYSGMRGQDYQGQQLSQQGQGIALQGAGQAGSQGVAYSQLQHGVNVAQLQARGNKEGQASADKWAQASQDQANRARQDAKEAGYMGAAATGGIGLAQAAASDHNSGKPDPTSDERAKVPVGIAPQEPITNPTYEASREAASRALEEEAKREARARAYGTPQSVGPATHGGVAALDRYEQDQVDTLRAKERHGVPLDAKEKRMAEAMKRGQKYGDKRDQPDTAPAGTASGPTNKASPPTQHGQTGPSALSQGLGVARDVSKDIFARPSYAAPSSFYTAPQNQQITSDMGAKRRIGLNDFMSDMGTKLPPTYSDERAKDAVGWDSLDRTTSHSPRMSMSMSNKSVETVREATPAPHPHYEADESDGSAAGLGRRALAKHMNEHPDDQPMFSDMGAKRQAPMWSDDQTKLLKAWEQGRKAGLQDADIGKRPLQSDAKKAEMVAADRKRALTDAALATRRAASPHPLEKPGLVKEQSPLMARGEEMQNSVGDKGMSLTERFALEPEPHELRPSGLAARLRASAAAARQPLPATPAPSSLPASGTGSPEHREDEAEVVSDERAKNASAWADAEIAKVKAEDERMSKRPPAVGSQHISDDAMAQAARSMEASPYAYKPEFKPEEQAPGEVNVGPMAQKMEKSPVAATAVRRDPQTGLRSLDRDKLIKVQGGILASQQKQIDDIKAAQLSREADRQIGNYKADRPAATNARQDAMMRQADEQIRNYRAERPASVIDRDRPAPPSWLSKYMNDDGEEEQRARRRLTSADFITRRRKA